MDLLISIFNAFSFSSDFIARAIFLVIFLAVIIASFVIFFHWKKYGIGGKMLPTMEFLYLAGSAVLLGIAFFALN